MSNYTSDEELSLDLYSQHLRAAKIAELALKKFSYLQSIMHYNSRKSLQFAKNLDLTLRNNAHFIGKWLVILGQLFRPIGV